MSLFLILAVAAALDVPPASHKNLVGFMDGEGLQFHCAASERGSAGLRDICAGYLAGSVDEILAVFNGRPSADPMLCDVANLNLEDVRLNVLTYIAQDPKAKKMGGAHIVLGALLASHPCPGSTDGRKASGAP